MIHCASDVPVRTVIDRIAFKHHLAAGIRELGRGETCVYVCMYVCVCVCVCGGGCLGVVGVGGHVRIGAYIRNRLIMSQEH